MTEKRIRRPPGVFKPLLEKPVKKRKPRPTGCHYDIIPLPPKYLETEALLLYGNIPLVQRNNDIFTDFSVLNEFHIYQGIQVTHYSEGQRILSIKTDRRTDTRFPRWKTFAKKWSRAKDPKQREWGKAVRKFSLCYEKQMNSNFSQNIQTDIKGTDSQKKDYTSKLNREQSGKIKVDLMSRYPCIQLKTSFRGFENRLVDIVVNEKLLDTLGYSIDSFVSTTLKEGLPQLFSLQSESNSCFVQKILECYSSATSPDCKTPGLDVTLLTRSGFVKPATVEIHFSMNPLQANCDSETIFVVTGQGEPYLPPQDEQPLQLNPDFLNIMYEKEESMCVLLYECYGYNFMPEYTNLHKICTIRELQEKEDSFCKLEPYGSL